MRIYQVNVVCGSGSTGRIAADLSQTIHEHGGESRIAYGRGDAPAEIDAIKISNKLDLYVHAILTRLTDKHGLYSKKSTKRLIRDIKAYNPDIIHLHNVHGYYMNYEMLFKFLKDLKKPIVWTLHDCWPFTGHCAHFDYIGCEKWKNECDECPQKSRYPRSVLKDNSKYNYLKKKEVFTLPEKMTIVTVSDWLKNVTAQSLLQKYPIKKISNGINLQIMKPTENDVHKQYHLENKKIVLGVASVWDEYKGIQTFFELSQYLSPEYQVVMIGLTEQQIKEKPERVLGIEKITNPKELAMWYTAAEVYVNASVEETMGLTTIEAMACGTPTVVMNTTANPELINGENGKVVESNSLEQLVLAIRSLKKDKKTMEACLKYAQDYEKSKQYKKYIQLYEELLYNRGECQ